MHYNDSNKYFNWLLDLSGVKKYATMYEDSTSVGLKIAVIYCILLGALKEVLKSKWMQHSLILQYIG